MTEIINKLLQQIAETGSKLISLVIENDIKLAVVKNTEGKEKVVEYINGEWRA